MSPIVGHEDASLLDDPPGLDLHAAPETTSAPMSPSHLRMLISIASFDGSTLERAFPAGVDVTLGRGQACHVILPSASVSRQHLTLRLVQEGIMLQDSSRQGTRIQGELLMGAARTFQDERLLVQLGPYQVVVERLHREQYTGEKRRSIFAELLSRLRLEKRYMEGAISDDLRREVRAALATLVAEPRFAIAPAERARLASELTDEALGLGPLESLLRDEHVSEIMVVDPQTVYAERKGKLELTGRVFTDAEAVRAAIERIVTPLGRRIDESSPLVDARLTDGSRVNAVIPPLALRGPCITIRKFPVHRLSMAELVQACSLDQRMARFLTRCVRLRKNVVISGGTGSGKTTLLNVLSAAIDPSERIVTIEDAAELNLAQPHVVGLEAKPPNLEGRGEFTIRDLVKNALRMRPDRIIVGECRGGEALDMLQAMNTGHDGSMTTTHANSPEQAVSRLETLCLMSGLELPLSAIRRQIADSVHVIIQQSRLADGSRKVTKISEVVGLNDEAKVEMRELFALEFNKQGCRWEHVASGFMPSFLAQLDRCFGQEGAEIF